MFKKATCVSNQKQVLLGLMLYADDHDGQYMCALESTAYGSGEELNSEAARISETMTKISKFTSDLK